MELQAGSAADPTPTSGRPRSLGWGRLEPVADAGAVPLTSAPATPAPLENLTNRDQIADGYADENSFGNKNKRLALCCIVPTPVRWLPLPRRAVVGVAVEDAPTAAAARRAGLSWPTMVL